MGLTIQGGIPPSPMASACPAKETRTQTVIVDRPRRVTYRTTHTKETGWSDILLTGLDRALSILSGLGKVLNLPSIPFEF
jgi:hypothetical protein